MRFVAAGSGATYSGHSSERGALRRDGHAGRSTFVKSATSVRIYLRRRPSSSRPGLAGAASGRPRAGPPPQERVARARPERRRVSSADDLGRADREPVCCKPGVKAAAARRFGDHGDGAAQRRARKVPGGGVAGAPGVDVADAWRSRAGAVAAELVPRVTAGGRLRSRAGKGQWGAAAGPADRLGPSGTIAAARHRSRQASGGGGRRRQRATPRAAGRLGTAA
ncbi:hypothetical protein ABVK25_012010 [Lepraria finkii]|uniref:Uncharacterized protein n=1 Tax=Lepraria finkii TaxID=1340010 RepID=A0ABR4AJB9_9LECA